MFDSCSSVDVISNRDLLNNIEHTDQPVRVHRNANTIMLYEQADLGDYP